MQPEHLLTGIETFGEEFPIKVPVLIGELAQEFNLDNKQLDKSEDSIRLLDMFLYHNRHLINEEFLKANLMRIEAYLGEVFIKKYGGTWQVNYDKEFDVYVPSVFINGKTVRFYPNIYEDLLDSEITDIVFGYRMSIPRDLRK